MACAPSVLSDHRSTLAARLAAIKARAVQLIGYDVNLSSSSQLAKVLYEDLRLTPPAGGEVALVVAGGLVIGGKAVQCGHCVPSQGTGLSARNSSFEAVCWVLG